MADDLTVTAGTGTIIRAVEKGVKKTQVVSLDLGGAGEESLLTTSMPIQDGGNSITVDGTLAVTNAGITTIAGAVAGTEMQVDVLTMPTVTVNAHAVTNAGTFVTQVDGAALTALQLIDNMISGSEAQVDVITMPVTHVIADSGTIGTITNVVHVDDNSGTLTVDGTVTANLSATDNAVLDAMVASLGATDGAKVITDANGTIQQYLRGLVDLVSSTSPSAVTGDITISNSTGAASVNIQDGGNTITVDGTVTANLSATDNAVLDAIVAALPAALAANGGLKVEGVAGGVAQPVSMATIPSHAVTNAGTFVTQVDGAALTALQLIDNMISGNEAQVDVVTLPGAADDGAVSGNPVRVGGHAVSALPAAVANNDTADILTDLQRRIINLPYANPENTVSGNPAAITNNTAQDVIAAQGAGIKIYLTSVLVTNSHASVGTLVTIQDDTGTPIVLCQGYAAAAGGGFSMTFPVPKATGANQKLQAICGTTGANVYVSAVGFKAA